MRRKRQVFTPNYSVIKYLFRNIAACVLFFMLLSGAGPLYGEQTWQGNAAMIRRGEFETAGYFAASNSFPLNTKILVKNLHNFRTTEVIVVQRLSEYYSVFLLLSEEAAYELGMSENTVINVEVTVIDFGTGDAIGLPDDLPYNPDPDVFPLPTVPDETARATPSPAPFPEDTPTPGPTEGITIEPTLEPGETLAPTPDITEIPTPEPTPGPTLEPTPEPLDAKLDRDPQKNLYLPPHEDEMYVLEDFIKPEEEKVDEDIPDPEIVNTDEFKGKAIDESISTPDQEDKESEISSLEMKDPEVEKPFIEDKTNPEVIASGINVDDPDEPAIVEKEKPVPDPSNEVPDIETYDIALEPQEPVVPGEKTPELSNEVPDPGEYDYDIALDSAEPGLPEEEIPDPSNEVPDATEYDIALEPVEPDITDVEKDIPDPSYELPDAEEIADIAMEPEEPFPPTEEERGKPDPSYEVPDAEDEAEIAMEPEEPYPPTEEERGKPDPSYEVPDAEDEVEIAMEPEDPDPPTEEERGKPDPSYELPEAEEETEITYNPVDPVPPDEDDKENGKEPDTDGTTPDNGEKDEIIPDEDEEIIIVFEETGLKPPSDEDMVYETDGVEEIGLEKGKYFIQLAAYTEKSPATAIEKQYSAIYPVKVYTITDKMLEIYKVMVGPLNKHESDTLLFRFKNLGFKDAFVKYSN